MTATITTRRTHFRRAPSAPIQPTEDDIKIIHHVGKHRFRRSTDIARYLGRSPKKVVERLTELYHRAYLDRPVAQLEFFSPGNRPPYIYALGNKGAALLAELHGEAAPKIDWTDKNHSVGRPFIQHALLISDVMTAAERIARSHPDVLLIEPEHILARAPEKTQRSLDPWKLTTSIIADGVAHPNASIIPDKAFGLDFTTTRKRSYFFLEADRATMPVWRRDLLQSSMRKKFLAYSAAHAAQLHVTRYGIGNFRVLTVSTSAERIANMIDAVQKITGGKGSNLFLFATAEAVNAADDLTGVAWTSGKTQTVYLRD